MNNQLRYKLFKVKKGKRDMFIAWTEELQRRNSEVITTLKYENVAMETMYIFSVSNEWFVIGMQVLVGKHRKADMTVELNKRHFEVLTECLVPYNGAVLYEFTRRNIKL